MAELERIDIITDVSMLASQLALPREGHLKAVFFICRISEGPSKCPDGIQYDIYNS